MGLKVAITGNIGSGKSTVIEIFKSFDIPVFNSDEEAKKLYLESEIKDQLEDYFGDIIFENGEIDKKKLANIIFSNQRALKKVNSIIHPVVMKRYISWHFQQTSPYTLKESAILFESNLQDIFDKIITVSAPENIRLERVMNRDGALKEDVEKRMFNQLSENIKCKFSDFVIINDGVEPLKPQIELIHNFLKNL